ncbi:MAG: LysM peptidoglycan-binding domain-containing protein [Roseibacillus sp.]
MRLILSLLVTSCLLVSCIPEGTAPQSNVGPAPSNSSSPASPSLVEDRLKTQNDRIGRLETELHEMRLLFTNQLKRIEEVANRPISQAATAYQPQQQSPQQVVIMPNNPVVTHRWDEAPQQRLGASNQTRAHSISSGDTLSEIAEAYGISVSSLLTANPGTDPLRLRIGKRLTIPSASQAAQFTAQAQARARSYTVQSGDTLSQIAERYGLGLSQLMSANPGIDPARMRVGKRLNIPSTYSSPANNQQPAGYASPPLRSIQREPQATPQSQLTPQYKSAPTPPQPQAPSHKMLIKIPKNTSFGEIAEKVGTDVDTLNQLNHCALSATSRIPANGTLYVPAPAPAAR